MADEQLNRRRLELEYAVLGALLKSPETAARVMAISAPEDFSWNILRSAYEAALNLYSRKAPVNRLTVMTAAGDDGFGEVVDDALAMAPAPANVEHYAETLKEQARLDRVRTAAAAAVTALDAEALEQAVREINAATVSRKRWQSVSFVEAMTVFVDRLGSERRPEYLDFLFPKLRSSLYAERGDFIILAGEPSSGKTALAAQLAVNLAKKVSVGFYTLETSPQKLTDRIVSQLTRIPLPKIKENNITEAELRSITETAQAMSRLKLELIPAAGMTVSDIRSHAISKGFELVFIDYLQIIRPGNQRQSRYEQVTQISMDLHTFAQENRVAVVALAQLSRPEKKQQNPQPTMHDLRESGQIEQDADAVLLLYRKDRTDNAGPRVLRIAKNKEGVTDDVLLSFDGGIQTFEQSAARWVPAPPKQTRRNSAQLSFTDLPDGYGGPLPF